MANKVKTRFDANDPNKNKVSTLVGINKVVQDHKDLLDFKVEHNGVEMSMSKFLERIVDRLDTDEKLLKATLGELGMANGQIGLLQEAISSLDTRLDMIENLGNI